ncbi:MAG: energy transducer TonB, partial [Proteobacteria bacterium]
VVEEDNTIYNSAGIEVKPEYPGGIAKFYKFVADNFRTPDDTPGGRMVVSFVVEKDGSLTDIKVVRDVGYGTKEEAIRTLKRSPRWAPAEQNGKKVRCTFTLPITIQAPQ